MPEQFPEPFYVLFQQGLDGLRGVVPVGEAGAAGEQHHRHLRVGDEGRHRGPELIHIIPDYGSAVEAMARLLQGRGQHAAGFVVPLGAGVRDGYHGDVQAQFFG